MPVGHAWMSGLIGVDYKAEGHLAEGHLSIWRSLHQVCLEDAQCFEWVVMYRKSHKSYNILVGR